MGTPALSDGTDEATADAARGNETEGGGTQEATRQHCVDSREGKLNATR